MSNTNVNYIQQQKARGERLKQIRLLAAMERIEFTARYKLNLATYKDWETAKRNSIPPSKAKPLIERLKTDGIIVNLNWLLHDDGIAPYRIENNLLQRLLAKDAQAPTAIAEEEQIKRELSCFLIGNPQSVSYPVKDDTMAPFFKTGDWVAGVAYDSPIAIRQCHDQLCIVKLQDQQLVLRRLQKGSTKNTYHLLTVNPNLLNSDGAYDQTIISVAPILWMRRRGVFPQSSK